MPRRIGGKPRASSWIVIDLLSIIGAIVGAMAGYALAGGEGAIVGAIMGLLIGGALDIQDQK